MKKPIYEVHAHSNDEDLKRYLLELVADHPAYPSFRELLGNCRQCRHYIR